MRCLGPKLEQNSRLKCAMESRHIRGVASHGDFGATTRVTDRECSRAKSLVTWCVGREAKLEQGVGHARDL